MADNYNQKNNSEYDDFESEIAPNKGKISVESIKQALSQPKNLVLLIAVFIVIIIFGFKVFFKSSKQKQVPQTEDNLAVQEARQVPTAVIPSAVQEPSPVETQPSQQFEDIKPPELPSLDISLIDGLDAIKNQPANNADDIDKIDLEALRRQIREEEEDEEEIEIPEEEVVEEVIIPDKPKKIRKIDPERPPEPIITSGGLGPVEKKSQKSVSDFIFIDSALDAELSTDVPNEGKKIPNLGNIVAQGRMIDAVLETAINSGVPGTIRAIITRNVYAEAGRSILIPKGTRLYGSYSAGNINSGRVIITWSRILRPDGISLSVNSFASDQFGRAGVQGNVDKRYGEVIASALLLSSIPLVATIAVQQATGDRRNISAQVGSGNNITTISSDPVNDATVKFGDEISNTTGKVVQGLIDTATVITIAQGTRIKVMVNQDLKLSAYKPITSLNTTVTYSSQ